MKKIEAIQIRTTVEEKEIIKTKAKQANKTVTDYILDLIINDKGVSNNHGEFSSYKETK